MTDARSALLARARRATRALGCTPAEIVALGVLVSGALLGLALVWVASQSAAAGDAQPHAQVDAHTLLDVEEPAVAEVVAHVAGAVAAPGLYRLPGDARVADAIEAAGGPSAEAVLHGLNLARPVADGEQILVPDADGPQPGSGDGPGGAVASAWRADGRLDINRASAADLQELPGIGPVTAERIIAHREANGPFSEVGGLREVTGIGEKTFQALAELVAV